MLVRVSLVNNMERLKTDRLYDLNGILSRVRMLAGVRELVPGTFYFGDQAFMHFHVEGQERFAHVRSENGWRRVYLPLHARRKVLRDACKQIIGSYASQAGRLGGVLANSFGKRINVQNNE